MKKGWKPDAIRGTRQARGYGAQWQRLRVTILRRDDGLCQPCLRCGRVTPATEVDHIRPKSKGGDDAPDNLQAICHQCHEAKTAADEGRQQQHTTGIDGWPLKN